MKQFATKLGITVVTALLFTASTNAHADSVTYQGSDAGNVHKARATFTVSGGKLSIDLFNMGTNAITSGVTTQDYILTGLFFDTGAGSLHLSNTGSDPLKSTITLGSGSGYAYGNTVTTTAPTPRGDVSQNWAYGQSVSPYTSTSTTLFNPTSSSYGVAATAYAASSGPSNPEFQDANRFNATSNGFLDGVDYGLITGANTGNTIYIKNGVHIEFAITSGLTSVSQLSSVYFKYDSRPGTVLGGQSGTIISGAAIPEPAYVQLSSLLMLGGVGSLFSIRKAKRKSLC